jgi:hypothetical protein
MVVYELLPVIDSPVIPDNNKRGLNFPDVEEVGVFVRSVKVSQGRVELRRVTFLLPLRSGLEVHELHRRDIFRVSW